MPEKANTLEQKEVLKDGRAKHTKLVKELSRVLGIQLRKSDVYMYDFFRLRRWRGIPPEMLEKVKTKKIKKFVYVEILWDKQLNYCFFEATPKWQREYGFDLVIVQNQQSSQEEEFSRCTIKTCMPDGECRAIEVITTYCIDECTGNSDCPVMCLRNTCRAGVCVPEMFFASAPCPDQFAECFSSSDCAEEGTNTTCVQKVCVANGFCHTITFQINDEEAACPQDECDDDEDCGGSSDGSDGGILQDITNGI